MGQQNELQALVSESRRIVFFGGAVRPPRRALWMGGPPGEGKSEFPLDRKSKSRYNNPSYRNTRR